MKPLISIVIPVYNAERTLDRCIASVLSQDYHSFEVILVDDGSEDRSGAMCDGYSSADPRIRVVHQDNRGVSCARNVGIMAAKGEYLFFLDSDDWLLSNTLSLYANVLDTHTCDAVIGGLTVHETNKEPSTYSFDGERFFYSDLWETMCRDNRRFGYAGGKLVRASIPKDHNLLFDTRMNSQEDVDFFLSVYEHCECVGTLAFAGYQYDFVPGKRTPPTWDFIANQMKLLRIARKKTSLSQEAAACVHRRILSLLYTGLYTASDQGNFDDVVQRIAQLEGLHALLKTVDAKGEHGFVARNFAAGRYPRLQRYFKVRSLIRDTVRTFRTPRGPER